METIAIVGVHLSVPMNTNDRNGWMPVLDFFSDGCFQQIKDFLEISYLLKMLVSL